jgi:hypothetical protein
VNYCERVCVEYYQTIPNQTQITEFIVFLDINETAFAYRVNFFASFYSQESKQLFKLNLPTDLCNRFILCFIWGGGWRENRLLHHFSNTLILQRVI